MCPQAAEVLQRESQKLMEYARYNETKGCGVAFRALVRPFPASNVG